MRRQPTIALPVLLAICPAFWLAAGAWAAVPVDKVHEGQVTARIIPPEGSGKRATSRHARATAVLRATGADSARLVLDGTFDRDGDAGFQVPLSRARDGWRGGADGFDLAILDDGTVRGQGRFGGQPIRFDGEWQGADLRLLVEITPTALTAGGFPAGTRFQFRYRLRHAPAAAKPEAEGDGCRKVAYRLRPRPNLASGTMDMVRVRECVD